MSRKKYPEAVETGQRIRISRKEKGLSMEELGQKLTPPASKGAVSNWENGYNLPNNNRLKQLSDILGVSTTYLLNGDKYAEYFNNETMLDDRTEMFERYFEKTLEMAATKNDTNSIIIDNAISYFISTIEKLYEKQNTDDLRSYKDTISLLKDLYSGSVFNENIDFSSDSLDNYFNPKLKDITVSKKDYDKLKRELIKQLDTYFNTQLKNIY